MSGGAVLEAEEGAEGGPAPTVAGSWPNRCCRCCSRVARLISVLLRFGRLPIISGWFWTFTTTKKYPHKSS